MSFRNCRIVNIGAMPEEYLAQPGKRGSREFVMSSTQLRSFGHSPRRWRRGYEPPETEAKEFGSLLDCFLLTREQFDSRYALAPTHYRESIMECPQCGSQSKSIKCSKCGIARVHKEISKPWNRNANFCADWEKNVESNGQRVITNVEMAEIILAADRIEEDEILSAFIESSDRQVWIAGEFHDEATGLVVPVKCLIDLLPRLDSEFAECVGDLKTTRGAAVLPWARFCYQMGYYIQAAFNLDMYIAATGGKEDRNTFCFVLQENYPPFETARRMLSQDFTALGRAEYSSLLQLYCRCLANDFWPSYDDTDEAIQGWSVVEAEPWMASKGQFAPKMSFPEEQENEGREAEVMP